jgi:4'-phosphopantetheinyl transferase
MSVPRTSALRLKNGEVEIWLTSMAAVGEALRQHYTQLLSAPEHARWQRFLVAGARDQYLIGRALLRTTLSRYADVPEEAWVFETNPYGCPFVAEPAAQRDLRFNLSHTDGLVACAVTRQDDIGVDVENTAREVDPLALAPTVFAAEEIADVAATPPELRLQRFFSYWTLKEAYIKARGIGLSLPLDGFWFELGGSVPRIRFSDRCPDRSECWYFEQRRPTARHKLAIAAATPRSMPPTVRWHWVVPMTTG